MINPLALCPCGSNKNYAQCCQPLHLQTQKPSTPAALMRSRYCAFVLKLYPYLIDTHHCDYRGDLSVEILAQDPPQWLSLEVLDSNQQGDKGEVTFQAWYEHNGQLDAIHEKSSFSRENGQWLYLEGEQFSAIFPKRNAPCPCASGKKYKQCCLK